MADEKRPLFTEEERALLAQQFYDLAELYPDGPEARELRERETRKAMTPEQQEKFNKMLGDAKLADNIGGATDVQQVPTKPEDLSPQKSAVELGQDLNKAGVTMDKE